jgi:hypothetical protein
VVTGFAVAAGAGVVVSAGSAATSELSASGVAVLTGLLLADALLLAELLADVLATGSFSFEFACAAITVAPITTAATSNKPAHNANFFFL